MDVLNGDNLQVWHEFIESMALVVYGDSDARAFVVHILEESHLNSRS